MMVRPATNIIRKVRVFENSSAHKGDREERRV